MCVFRPNVTAYFGIVTAGLVAIRESPNRCGGTA